MHLFMNIKICLQKALNDIGFAIGKSLVWLHEKNKKKVCSVVAANASKQKASYTIEVGPSKSIFDVE